MHKLAMNLVAVFTTGALIVVTSACDTRAVADGSKTQAAPHDAGAAPSPPDAGAQGSRKKDPDKAPPAPKEGSGKKGSGKKGSGSSSTTSPPRGYE